MKLTIELPEQRPIKFCKLCGRKFTKAEYEETMNEQTQGDRPDCGKYFANTEYCGLYCAWLQDPDMVSTLLRLERCDKQMCRKQKHVEEMKDDIAKRVAKYLLKEALK